MLLNFKPIAPSISMAFPRAFHADDFHSITATLNTQVSIRDPLNDLIRRQTSFFGNPNQLPLFNINSTVLSPLLNIHKPNNNTSSRTKRKKEWETHPII